MKTITTRQGDELYFDDTDYETIFSKLDFDTREKKRYKYPVLANSSITPHRLIFGKLEEGMVVDHINGDPFDNRRENLRVATIRQNCYNRGKDKRGFTSKYKGVSIVNQNKPGRKPYRCFKGSITAHGNSYKKFFQTEIEAALWYNRMATKLFGEYARLNVIEDKQLKFWEDK